MTPLDDIERKQGMYDLGRTAVDVYRGARGEAEDAVTAFWSTVAVLVAMMNSPPKEEA